MPLLSFSLRLPHLYVDHDSGSESSESSRWNNKDLEPVPPNDRKWGLTALICYWISDAFNASSWQFAASMIAIGFTWRECFGVVALAFTLISIPIAMNGAMGGRPFPVLARASFGFRGSYLPILTRAILGLVWFAIQVTNGANAVRVMIGAIWPSFLSMENNIPENQGIASNTMIAFLIFWLAHIPFLYMHPNKALWLFIVKSVIVPVTWVAILIWALASTGGGDIWKQKSTLAGSDYGWAFISCLTSVIGNSSAACVNQADFSRYSRINPKWQILYIPMLPTVFVFIAFIGVATASAGQIKYGVTEWDPTALIALWDSRAARFFGGFSFALATLGVNISANSISAANDLAALAPKYIDIRRGQLIVAVCAWAIIPWKILESATTFLNFMQAYCIFIGPIAAIIVMDFFVVHKGKYSSPDLYNPDGIYKYRYDVNWRSFVAFFVAITPVMPGFINSINSQIDVGLGVYPYKFAWLLGFVGASGVYIALSLIFKAHGTFIDLPVLPQSREVTTDVIIINGQEMVTPDTEANIDKRDVALTAPCEKN
ncbi:hypothetical protein N7493_000867 [Penicillium malachiteum]|uniref:Allantoin permease n=1 Tax=Penicillium malachiteum TaxID=1324776 RepID=A0AAD6N1U0_9EURO|nr:hypothetical protein N7493_000867 [Penicillium malachiteum]